MSFDMSLDSPEPTNASFSANVSSPKCQATTGIVIIGAGMAGSRFAIELARAQQSSRRERNAAHLPITLISKEPQVGYNRIMLSPVLSGESVFEETYLYELAEYEQLGITVLAGTSVDAIETNQQCVKLSDGQTLDYTELVLATGSQARVIPFANHDAKGVHVFREIADVQVLTEYARQAKKGLVIGGGVLGLEAACALASQGADMTVVHVDSHVLNRQLDIPAAHLLQAELFSRSVKLEVLANTECITVNDQHEVNGLLLKDGRTLPADFIVMAVGVIPNTTLAQQSGLEVNRGILVDNFMHTSCPHVYAIGECIELDGELFGMVAPVNQQVDTLVSVLKESSVSSSRRLSSDSRITEYKNHWRPFISKPLSLKLKVSGIAAFSAGQIAFDDIEMAQIERVVYQQTSFNHYLCLYIKESKLIGTVLYGDVSESGFYSQLITDGSDISSIKEDLIFGEAYCDVEKIEAAEPESAVPSDAHLIGEAS